VEVLYIDKVSDPSTGNDVDCVAMELLNGETLEKCLLAKKFSIGELKHLGVQLIDGVSHIHKQGMAHGDLHVQNVMVAEGVIKVIDILYLNSLALLSTEHRDVRFRRDLVSLRLMLQEMIVHSELNSGEASEFNNLLGINASCDEMRDAFLKVVSPDVAGNLARNLDHAFGRLIDPDFIKGATYAAALADETPQQITVPLLKRLIEEYAYQSHHKAYIHALWARLSAEERVSVLTNLSTNIDKEIPSGKFGSGLHLLLILGPDAWNGLSTVVQLRLENAVTKDVLAGHKDIHAVGGISKGILGTWGSVFWKSFKNPSLLADNIISLLRQSWYTQNYVGTYFMKAIPDLAVKTNKKDEFISAFRIAIANDARIVVNELGKLPGDWVESIKTT